MSKDGYIYRERIGSGTAPIKAKLLDQSHVAGIGNLLADQILWQAKLSPERPAGELERRRAGGWRSGFPGPAAGRPAGGGGRRRRG